MLGTITEKHPPLALEYLVKRINSFDYMTIKGKHAFLYELISVHPLISCDYSKGTVFRRTRRLSKEHSPENISELLWNPSESNVGRANLQGRSVLYVSDRIETSLKEARAFDGYVSLSEFQIREGEKFRICPLGELLTIQRTGHAVFLNGSEEVIQSMINACDEEDVKSLLITDSFLLKCFLAEDESYSLSSFIAETIFGKNSEIEGIGYSSVQQYRANNVAIRAERFWKSWAVVGVRIMSVSYLAEGFYHNFDVGHVTKIDADGNLRWIMNTYHDSGMHPLTPWFRKS